MTSSLPWFIVVPAIFVVFGAVLTALFNNPFKSILALWLTGVNMGFLYLVVGAQFAGVVQWMISTIMCISLFFHVAFYGISSAQKNRAKLIFSVLVSALFLVIISVYFPKELLFGIIEEVPFGKTEKTLLTQNIFPVITVGFTILITLVGAGAVLRREVSGE